MPARLTWRDPVATSSLSATTAKTSTSSDSASSISSEAGRGIDNKDAPSTPCVTCNGRRNYIIIQRSWPTWCAESCAHASSCSRPWRRTGRRPSCLRSTTPGRTGHTRKPSPRAPIPPPELQTGYVPSECSRLGDCIFPKKRNHDRPQPATARFRSLRTHRVLVLSKLRCVSSSSSGSSSSSPSIPSITTGS